MKDEVVIDGMRYTQNGQEFVSANIPHVLLKDIFYVVPYTSKTPHGDQRFPSERRIEQFKEDILSSGSVRPQSLIGTLTNGARFEDVSGKMVKVIIPKAKGKYIRVVDGQKSIESVTRAGENIGNGWDHSIALSDDDRDEVMKKRHSDANMKLQKDDTSVDTHKAFDVCGLTANQMRAGKIWDKMAEDKNSIIYHRVNRFHDDSGGMEGNFTGLIPFNGLIDSVTKSADKYLRNGNNNIFEIPEIEALNTEDLYPIVNGCMKAWRSAKWRDCRVDIWDDPASYVLSSPRGIKILGRTLRLVFEKCLRKYGSLTLANCKEIIQDAASKTNYRLWQRLRGKENTPGHIYLELKKKIGFHTKFAKARK